MTRLLIIQPDATDPIGPLGDWLAEAGAELDVRLPPEQDVPASLDGYAGVVCLGGGMNALDDGRHPWLADVRKVLASAAGKRAPTLGVCLGAQLLAAATGGQVAVGEDGPEVGPSLVSKKDAAWTDPLFAELPLVPDVLQFHSDVVRRLPPGAELLASSPRYHNQAFRLNGCAYGIQFHIETTPDVVRAWAESAPQMAELTRPGGLAAESLSTLHADLAETWRPFAHRFVRLAAGELTMAPDGQHRLPLV
ncbi:type 1 glutamine amidotransferase [Amycolatopsis jiangsuensis]|uniref:GMP synthase-like glutamine amidotransferase n=1 Tax=Amycolatopsis jiangsuensis TaxID=1181879 RepID=A0A840IXK5_9PSEU|nr:type 1 glutamine amidotransferase [Amycolatopsis jiangsuensis]MBB4685942.1 GMP synthase-like glutamine amidotransferase [Amycolatopsis jiangsuensis]